MGKRTCAQLQRSRMSSIDDSGAATPSCINKGQLLMTLLPLQASEALMLFGHASLATLFYRFIYLNLQLTVNNFKRPI